MTLDEVLGPVMVPIAFGVAVVAALLLVRHVARRYPALPPRAPLGFRLDGRPSTRPLPKQMLWSAPAVIIVVLAVLGAALLRDPPREDQRTVVALVFVTIAEVAWFTAWSVDRQIELVRKMTYRIPPARLLRAFSPILATLAVALVLALRS